MDEFKPVAREGNLLFPVFLKLEELQLLIVGGGNVGLEKLTAVLRNSPATNITLVATLIFPEVRAVAKDFPNVALHERPYQESDLIGKDIVIVAANNRELSEIIKREARKHKVLANVADTPDLCDFYLGSVVKKGDLKIAAKRIRQYLEESLPDSTQELLDNLQQIRNQITGDFEEKLRRLNEVTSGFLPKKEKE
jgi:siroheme synthase-like protein